LAVSEEDIKEEELMWKLKEIVKCPYISKCDAELTENEFETFCVNNPEDCIVYVDFCERKKPIDWAMNKLRK
jgi:hypothetical protein